MGNSPDTDVPPVVADASNNSLGIPIDQDCLTPGKSTLSVPEPVALGLPYPPPCPSPLIQSHVATEPLQSRSGPHSQAVSSCTPPPHCASLPVFPARLARAGMDVVPTPT